MPIEGDKPRPAAPVHDEQQQHHHDPGSRTDVEAALSAAANAGIDPAVEKRVRRKFDRTVVLLFFTAYMLSFLDRSNIGNAQAAGMSADLGFDDAHYQVGLPVG